jgi:cytochrome c oxidase cbb3-type subunit 3
MKRLLLLCWAATVLAQAREIKNPHTSPADVAAGNKIFHSHCAECHGLDGKGGKGPNLASGVFFHGGSDADLLRNISEGIPGTQMPGIFFSDNQVWQVVAYLRSLDKKTDQVAEGNPVLGEKLFRSKGDCARCHRVSGQGGRLGPDLTHIGSLRSSNHLREALLKPSAEVDPQFWLVRLKQRDGTNFSGFRMNEDTYTIQILDLREQLHSFLKQDLQDLQIEKTSSMPSYEGVFTASELGDLVAYLSSLRRKTRSQ